MDSKDIKVCLISSSGGHYEQLKMLKKLSEKYNTYFVTEKTEYDTGADYYLIPPSGFKNKTLRKIDGVIRFAANTGYSLVIFCKEKPDVVVTTGSRAAVPTVFWAHAFGKKTIYIETFARVHDGTRAGGIVYRHKWYDLFLYQWESLRELYPDGVYGGGIY